MRILIVDDHKINRSLLKVLVNDHFPEVTLIDEAESVRESLELLETGNYDLILLDIELKDGVGFDILKEMSDFIYVIVISSHKDYAIEAFKHNVVDYLLRPINIPDFKRAVKKTFDLIEKSETYRKLTYNDEQVGEIDENGVKYYVNRPTSDTGNVLVNYKNAYTAVPKKDIIYIQAQGKCSEIFVSEETHYTSYKNLKEFELALDGCFVRVHHSYLININYMSHFYRETSSLRLVTGREVPVSTRKKEELLKKFSLF